MDFIYTDKNYEECGYLRNASIDIEIGKYRIAKNDFAITLSTLNRDTSFEESSLFYCNETEYGGIVDNIKVDTEKRTVTFQGKTFRGLLEKEYIQPPTGEAYLELNGNFKECFDSLISNGFDGLFVVDSTNITIQYNVRDMNMLEALEKALAKSNAKLVIKCIDGVVHLIAESINDLSETIQYDNSLKVFMNVETEPSPYNHILALGSGELTERLRLNLYRQEDGTWGENEFYSGLSRLTYKYDNSNASTIEELRSGAIESVERETSTDRLAITLEGDDVELFDIVAAKEEITGISFKQQVTQKILKGKENSLKVSYKVGE